MVFAMYCLEVLIYLFKKFYEQEKMTTNVIFMFIIIFLNFNSISYSTAPNHSDEYRNSAKLSYDVKRWRLHHAHAHWLRPISSGEFYVVVFLLYTLKQNVVCVDQCVTDWI